MKRCARQGASTNEAQHGSSKIETSHLILIVVGTHMRAEAADRPLAYKLREQIHAWLEEHSPGLNVPLTAVVCSDLLYMNDPSLQDRPTICLGGPGVNRLSAFYAEKLPAAIVRDNKMIIQLDTEFIDLRVCVWGMNHDLTTQALDVFTRKHLPLYLRAVATQVEPQDDTD